MDQNLPNNMNHVQLNLNYLLTTFITNRNLLDNYNNLNILNFINQLVLLLTHYIIHLDNSIIPYNLEQIQQYHNMQPLLDNIQNNMNLLLDSFDNNWNNINNFNNIYQIIIINQVLNMSTNILYQLVLNQPVNNNNNENIII
jgi:hypothetical protein